MPYYNGDPKRDPNFDNHPCMKVVRLLPVEALLMALLGEKAYLRPEIIRSRGNRTDVSKHSAHGLGTLLHWPNGVSGW